MKNLTIIPYRLLCLTVLLLAVMTGSLAYAQGKPLITVRQAADNVARNQAILVDTRPAASYAKAWIPGSVNVQPAFISGKGWLKGKQLILVNEGFAMTQLLAAAEKLNGNGFRAVVLAGGLATWQQEGQKLSGDFFAGQEFFMVAPHQVLQETGNSDYLFVNGGKSLRDFGASAFPAAKSLAKQKTARSLQQLAKKHQPVAMLLLTDETPGQPLMNELRVADQKMPLFFVKGGLTAIKEYQQGLVARQQPREQRLKKIGGCATCPQQDKKERVSR